MDPVRLCVLLLAIFALASATSIDFKSRSTSHFSKRYIPDDLDLYSIKSQDLEYGLVHEKAQILLARNNITGNNEVFTLTFVEVTEVMGNGTAARDPVPLVNGNWQNMEFQDNGGVLVVYYSQNVLIDTRSIEIDIVLAIANNRTTFFTLFGNHTLEKDDMKIGILINDWPFLSPENNLNITITAFSDRHNGTEIKRDDDNVEYSEFGKVDDDDFKVLHIDFEHSCILDGNKANNVTVYQEDKEHTIYVTLPHHEQYVYYDPLVTIAEPEGSSGGSSHTVLIVVLCVVGALILLACIALIIFFIWRRRRQNYEIIE